MDIKREDFHLELKNFMAEQSFEQRFALGVRGCLRVLPDVEPMFGAIYDVNGNEISSKALLQTFHVAISLNTSLRMRKWECQNFLSSLYHQKKSTSDLTPLNDLWKCLKYSAGKHTSYSSGGPESWGLLVDAISGSFYLPRQRLDAARFDRDVFADQTDLNIFFELKLWQETPELISNQLDSLWANINSIDGAWEFWQEWYQTLLDGQPLDWELQRRVALVPDEDWKKGPAHIAEKIEEIRRAYNAEKTGIGTKPQAELPVSPAAAQAMAKRLATNRDAIALCTTGLLDQIADFREKVRGDNQLDPEFKERLLEFLDNLSARLNDLIGLLPADIENTKEETGEKGVRWLRGFRQALLENGREYVDPKNIAGAAIPTGIILFCTGVGSLLGMPVAGTVIGGLLTGQLKPGKAADDLLKPSKQDADP